MVTKNKAYALNSIILICSMCFITACKSTSQSTQQQALTLPVAQAKKGTGTVSKEYAASIKGLVNIEIRSQVSGYLNKIFVDEGDFVKAGQVLFKIDDRTYAEQYNTAKAAVIVAKANLVNAKIELDRRKELVSNKIVSDLQVQQAAASYEAAKAAILQAEANAQSAKINYEFCTIKAPVSGYIGGIPYRLGSLINPGNPEPLTLLSDVHEVNVYFSMSENDFLNFQSEHDGNTIEQKIKNAAPVGLKIADGNLYHLNGKINAVEGQFSNGTGSIKFRARFNNPNSLLRDGNTGKIIITQNFKDAILIPIASTFTVQDKVYLFSVDKSGKAVQLPVDVQGKSGTDYMITSGIKEDENYIISGFERLQPGMPVTAAKSDK